MIPLAPEMLLAPEYSTFSLSQIAISFVAIGLTPICSSPSGFMLGGAGDESTLPPVTGD